VLEVGSPERGRTAAARCGGRRPSQLAPRASGQQHYQTGDRGVLIDRRTLPRLAPLAASRHCPRAQDKPLLRLTGVYHEKDIRFETFRQLAKDVEADFRIEQYLMGSLFKQGTELVAVQRDNL
jgi:hypothetical protein